MLSTRNSRAKVLLFLNFEPNSIVFLSLIIINNDG